MSKVCTLAQHCHAANDLLHHGDVESMPMESQMVRCHQARVVCMFSRVVDDMYIRYM